MIWAIIAVLSLGVLAFLVWPLFRAKVSADPVDEKDYLTAQLLDVERDRKAGVLSEEDAAAADLEARRRLLSAARAERDSGPRPVPLGLKRLPAVLAGAAPACAVALYFSLGNPGQNATELGRSLAAAAEQTPQRGPSAEDMAAAEALTDEQRASMIAGMVEGLAARLKDNPDDLQGWTMLARSYATLGEFDKSINAFENAIALSPDDLALRVGHAQALLVRSRAAGEPIGAEAKEALEEILRRDSGQPLALFFLGVAAQQAGDAAGAKAHWEKLLARLPPDADETARIRAMIEAL